MSIINSLEFDKYKELRLKLRKLASMRQGIILCNLSQEATQIRNELMNVSNIRIKKLDMQHQIHMKMSEIYNKRSARVEDLCKLDPLIVSLDNEKKKLESEECLYSVSGDNYEILINQYNTEINKIINSNSELTVIEHEINGLIDESDEHDSKNRRIMRDFYSWISDNSF